MDISILSTNPILCKIVIRIILAVISGFFVQVILLAFGEEIGVWYKTTFKPYILSKMFNVLDKIKRTMSSAKKLWFPLFNYFK